MNSQEYVPAFVAARFRGQAWRVWAVGLAVVAFWVLLTVLAPAAKANGLDAVASPLYTFYRFLCHQLPDRSFHIAGEQFAVCSRCFGVYFGILLGFAIYPLWRRIDEIEPLSKVWLFLSLIPIGIDWSLTYFGIWENTQASRFLTGLILGAACATFIVPAAVEITRNLTKSETELSLTDGRKQRKIEL
ncbi:MAG: DUF2085 domain-containing protein [Pyrinomonadaceae bacterium]|nr:DUF2085 domain-containing protein [Pyrinomonadaceae bacterium]